MGTSSIFIASSGRTLVLAEKLRDELRTDFADPILWSEESRGQPSATIIEMLETAAKRYDFAVIILARDDVLTSAQGSILKARDNCVFEAGLFMSAIGRERCFLVTSVNSQDLPSDLRGVISIAFTEPGDLQDRKACSEAVRGVAAQLKDVVQRAGPSPSHADLPLISVDELFRRERPVSEGGDLVAGNVVVCETQPWAEVNRPATVRRNIDHGTSYQYFFHLSDDTIDKVCLSLQIIAWSGVLDSKDSENDFKARLNLIKTRRKRVRTDLLDICRSGRLRISFVPDEQPFYFRVHNASNPAKARYYARYGEDGFVLWCEHEQATTLWRQLHRWLAEDKGDQFFIPLVYPNFIDAQKKMLQSAFERGLRRYFPGLEDELLLMILGRDL
jgi:hypothetical protein